MNIQPFDSAQDELRAGRTGVAACKVDLYHCQQDALRRILHVQELSCRLPRTPNNDVIISSLLRFEAFVNQRGDHVGAFQVEVIPTLSAESQSLLRSG